MDIDPRHVDEVLATTRAVRRRLDLERPVDNQFLLDCIDLAEQAPTGGNLGSRRWVIVRDQAVKDQLGELYRETALPFMAAAAERLRGTGHPQEQVMASAAVPRRAPRRGARDRHPHDHRPPRRQWPPRACSTRSSRRRGASASRCGRGAWARTWVTAALAGRGQGEGDPRHPGPHDRDRAVAGGMDEGHRVPPRAAAPGASDHLLRPLRHHVRARSRRDLALRGRSRRDRRDRHRRLAGRRVGARHRRERADPVLRRVPSAPSGRATNAGSARCSSGATVTPAVGEWTLPCIVDACDEPSAFGWRTSDPDNPGARWRFDLEPAAGRTRLRFSYVMGPGPSGTTMAITANPGKEARVLRRRLDEVQANMQRTVEGIKQLAEASP